MAPLMRPRLAGRTDVGRQRDQNEDAFILLPDFGAFAVADGLGGHRSGQLASQLAVSTLSDFFTITVGADATWPFPYDDRLSEEENYLNTAARLANRRIFDRSQKTMADFGMGTTLVAGMFDKKTEHFSVVHAGDSRCYRVRGGEITPLTRDHSLVSDAIHVAPWMTPEEIAQLPPSVITRALGIREDVVVDMRREPALVGDIYVLCSDGLTGLVSDEGIRDLVVEHAIKKRKAPDDDSLELACQALVDAANDAGGDDNVTVVLAEVDPVEPTPPE